jgi:hypothetical protein
MTVLSILLLCLLSSVSAGIAGTAYVNILTQPGQVLSFWARWLYAIRDQFINAVVVEDTAKTGASVDSFDLPFKLRTALVDLLANHNIRGVKAILALSSILNALEAEPDESLRPSTNGLGSALENVAKKYDTALAQAQIVGMENIAAFTIIQKNRGELFNKHDDSNDLDRVQRRTAFADYLLKPILTCVYCVSGQMGFWGFTYAYYAYNSGFNPIWSILSAFMGVYMGGLFQAIQLKYFPYE